MSEFVKNDFEIRKTNLINTLTAYWGGELPEEVKDKINRNIRVLNKIIEAQRKQVKECGFITSYSELNEKYPYFIELC